MLVDERKLWVSLVNGAKSGLELDHYIAREASAKSSEVGLRGVQLVTGIAVKHHHLCRNGCNSVRSGVGTIPRYPED